MSTMATFGQPTAGRPISASLQQSQRFCENYTNYTWFVFLFAERLLFARISLKSSFVADTGRVRKFARSVLRPLTASDPSNRQQKLFFFYNCYVFRQIWWRLCRTTSCRVRRETEVNMDDITGRLLVRSRIWPGRLLLLYIVCLWSDCRKDIRTQSSCSHLETALKSDDFTAWLMTSKLK